jgi:hypothetical protein
MNIIDVTGWFFDKKHSLQVYAVEGTENGINHVEVLRYGLARGYALTERGEQLLQYCKGLGQVFTAQIPKKRDRLVTLSNAQLKILGDLIVSVRGDDVSDDDIIPKWAEIQNSLMSAAGPLPLEWGRDDLYTALGRWWKENGDRPVAWLTQPLRAALSAMLWDAALDDKPEEKAATGKAIDWSSVSAELCSDGVEFVIAGQKETKSWGRLGFSPKSRKYRTVCEVAIEKGKVDLRTIDPKRTAGSVCKMASTLSHKFAKAFPMIEGNAFSGPNATVTANFRTGGYSTVPEKEMVLRDGNTRIKSTRRSKQDREAIRSTLPIITSRPEKSGLFYWVFRFAITFAAFGVGQQSPTQPVKENSKWMTC